uniref:Kinase n=1 Tax=Macrostomum lignano TaxID=282301 RepID=A0A1I8FUW0_9PLAT
MQSEQLRQFVPIFYREVEHRGEYFLELEDLLHHFKNPSIMDVKMGSRTFLESEVTNPVLRTDLYKKMVELDPNEPTAEEKQHQAVTKLRYMRVADIMHYFCAYNPVIMRQYARRLTDLR